MARQTKIKDQAEAADWLASGMPYRRMVELYEEKYGITTSISMWAALRRRLKLPARIVRDRKLMPWEVRPEHLWAHQPAMLRQEARRRADFEPHDPERLESWKRGLDEQNLVVHYDPDTEEGWWYVPRREGVDKDLIREPNPDSP